MKEPDMNKELPAGGEALIAEDYYQYLAKVENWLKTSYRNGLQVQVLLRVIYAHVVQW